MMIRHKTNRIWKTIHAMCSSMLSPGKLWARGEHGKEREGWEPVGLCLWPVLPRVGQEGLENWEALCSIETRQEEVAALGFAPYPGGMRDEVCQDREVIQIKVPQDFSLFYSQGYFKHWKGSSETMGYSDDWCIWGWRQRNSEELLT